MKKKKIGDLIRVLEMHAPSSTAEPWDNVGLLAGDPEWSTSGAIVAIDLTEQAIAEAKKRGFRLILNHHPCIFPKSKGLSRIVAGSSKAGKGKAALVFEAIREGIAIAAYHTNFDRCALEVAHAVSDGLGLTPRGRLIDNPAGSLLKLAVFVPASHVEGVREAIAEAGGGHIGDYDSCSFMTEGQGTFRGGSGTDPFIGQPGKLERASELKLETVVPRGLERAVVEAMIAAHPYEEVAYDLYPLEQGPSAHGLVKGVGYGFWGEFAKPRLFSEVLQCVKEVFKVNGFLLTQSEGGSRRIRRVAFAAGKGASVVSAAAALGCDLMITGEAGYHEALAARAASMEILELGHTESERFFVKTARSWLKGAGVEAVELFVRTQRWV